MRIDSGSPPPPKNICLGLRQNQEATVVGKNQNTNTTTRTTTIHQLGDEVIEISLALLGGNGHFRYGPLACKMFLRASELNPHFKKISSGESVTSSISCAKKYFQDKEGTDKEQLRFFWENAARYGRLDIMEWAHQQGFSHASSACTCAKAAEYGQLQALQWLKENGCDWNCNTCLAAARNGHLAILQWARGNGCDWYSDIFCAAAEGGHLSILQWARENGCNRHSDTCRAAAKGGHLSCLQWARDNGFYWDKKICEVAAANGHLSCLQWARENGCPGADKYKSDGERVA